MPCGIVVDGDSFALQGIVGCAGAAAGSSGDCGSAAMGAATSVVLNNLLDGLGGPRDEDLNHDGKIDTADERLSLKDQQARTDLVATLVTAIAEGAGLDATSANYAARIETQNNAERTAEGNHVERVTRTIPEGYGLDELYGKSAEFQTLLDEVAESTGLTADQLIENYNAWSACIGAEPEVCSVEHNEFYDAFG
ncbi:hypothetical protein IDJ81_07130 [Tsuneonella flava]|uniref:Toxin CdiA n=1 Tax=Tsuneonella flava TaxID=2055955 RepID=A0ABX7KC57_9SPHN|nr:hypothetical protein [Tsuneonella flava]QSB45846.1 hypothetical protein IDJ81_07130 [Tsuneonella flava]